MPTNSYHSHSTKVAQLHECTALAQYKNKHNVEALHSLLRALHFDPIQLRFWYNIALVRGDWALQEMKRPEKTVAEIRDATAQLDLSHQLFQFLGRTSSAAQASAKTSGGSSFLLVHDKETAQRHARVCEQNRAVFAGHLAKAEKVEQSRLEEKRRQDAEHQEWFRQRQQVREKEQLAARDMEVEKQNIAREKARRLEEMREKWTTLPAASSGPASAGPKSKKRALGKEQFTIEAASRGEGRSNENVRDEDENAEEEEEEARPGETSFGVGAVTSSIPVDELFGSDDESSDGATNDISHSKRKSDGVEVSAKRGRLVKRSRRDEDDNDDAIESTEVAMSPADAVNDESDNEAEADNGLNPAAAETNFEELFGEDSEDENA